MPNSSDPGSSNTGSQANPSQPPKAVAIAPPMSARLRTQLSAMMFLQYAIWGAWLPLLWPYLNTTLGFNAHQIADIFAVGALGAIIAPFVAGQLADRYFSTEKFLAISHLIGGILVFILAYLHVYWQFLVFSLVYSLVYSPTLPLTNSLAFHHLPDRDRDFGQVRVWGTVGWIAVGITVAQWLLHHHTPAGASADEMVASQARGMADAFKLSGILGIAMGFFCFLLPHTPPSKGKKKNASLEALGEIKKNPLLTLFLLAVPISCIHQFYFVHSAGFLGQFQAAAESAQGDTPAKRLFHVINEIFGVGGSGLMTVGQISEFCVLALMPILAKTLSRKTLLAIGIIAYGLRMFFFAYVNQLADAMHITPVPILIVGIAMHGLAFGCFIFVAFMVVDEQTTGDVRASAQSLFNLVIVGVGIIVGSEIAGWVQQWATIDKGHLDYTKLFSVPMWASVACLAALLIFYPSRSRKLAP
jgi:nucleoside transporter